MEPWGQYESQQAHYRELREAAERERRIRASTAGGRRARPFFGPALCWLGRQLSVWGARLRIRYGEPGGLE